MTDFEDKLTDVIASFLLLLLKALLIWLCWNYIISNTFSISHLSYVQCFILLCVVDFVSTVRISK